MRIHHLQAPIPAGGEDLNRQFYGDLLDMEELDKPRALQARGGCWFRADSAWWFDSDGLDEIETNLEPVWSPVVG